MKPFRQVIPTTVAAISEQIAAILTIDAFETDPARREQIDLRVSILSDYLQPYNEHMGATARFLRDPVDNSLCFTFDE